MQVGFEFDINSSMESLQSLIVRAQAIHNKLNDEIDSSLSFCKLCSEHGRYCDVKVTCFAERERLIGLRNSLKEVEDLLVYLQKLQSWQVIDRHAALTCLENSRLYLMEQATGYQGREVDALKELNACFGNEKTTSISIFKDNKKASPSGKKRRFSFFIRCIRFYLDPWKLPKAVGIAAKLLMISASISSTLHVYHSRQKNYTSKKSTNALLTNPKKPLDVFSGRG